ncbi:MAG TPA: thiol reductant ABC exporter subunit CydC [Bellilinea sp.]|nr:thiol reductant ABC exporter subunit CydC [Bellilinea sp.]
MKTTWRLLQFLKPFTGWVVLSVLLSSATIASGIGLLGTSAYLISRAALQPSIALLQVAIVGVRFFGISRGIFRYLERLTAHSVNFRLLARLRTWIYRTIEPLAPARLQDYSSGDLLNRILTDVDTLENFYVRVVAPYVAAGLTILGMGLFIGRFYGLLGLVLGGGLILSGFVIPALAYLLSRAAGRAVVALKASLSTALVADLQGMSDLTAYNRASDSSQHLVGLTKSLGGAQRRLVWVSAWINASNGLLTNLTMVAVLWLAIPLVSSGKLEGFMLPVITMLVMASFEAVTPLATAAQFHASSQESGARLFQLESLTPAIVQSAHPLEIPPPPLELELSHVSFLYEPGADAALQDISLKLSPGKKIALIGPSGAGKTSLANILLRLWEFDSGEISLNGLDLRRFQPAQVRNQFSVISQVTYLFNATLGQNLRLAQPGATDDTLLEALRQAGLSEEIAALPHGLDTWLGEHGTRLSGGERQRVAIARALLQNTPLVILDEPTANLDVLTEAAIIDELHTALADKCVLWITHRLVSLEWMDEIIVLDSGGIAERGTHTELIKADGLYARLLELQKQTIPLTFSSPPS